MPSIPIPTSSGRIVFGIDPGFADCGWGVIRADGRAFRALSCGSITTPAKQPFAERLETVADELDRLFVRFKPSVVSIEQLFFISNKTTAMRVAEARGVALLAARRRRIPIIEVTPLQVKQVVTGSGAATKLQVAKMICLRLGLEKPPKNDNAVDGLAIAFAGASKRNS